MWELPCSVCGPRKKTAVPEQVSKPAPAVPSKGALCVAPLGTKFVPVGWESLLCFCECVLLNEEVTEEVCLSDVTLFTH